ncbi:T9SS type A sorting domain-containing protein [Flavobacterium cellulosilyticum]|uniref:T9SS type A sorting domain-containing protein n=1 Tax=Flavobacterium cellulosilyticum TaxID=2541731 RepID=A0A4R5CBU4_9FLAO|nr:T9SS type A sorting domain-containing protein [Flavobacterium cellulosilyticum]TDD95730.1 T9SS type A sorting domain-containing protein [Flavobacterium cellulosilyticum]
MKKNYSFKINQLTKNRALLFCAFGFMATININAQTWTGTTDTDYATATNWDTGVVPSASAVVINPATNNPILSSATTATCTTLAINAGGSINIKGTLTPSVANYTGGTLIVDGGNLNVRSNLNLGVLSNPATVTVNSGNLNAKNALIISEKGDCVLNINGGLVSVDQSSNGGAIIIGGYYAVGTVNLNGGILKTSSSKLGVAALAIQEQPTRTGTGSMTINGGTLVFTNDQKAFVDGYVTAGKIIPGVGKHIVVTVVPAIAGDATATPPIVAVPAMTNVTAEANLGLDANTLDNTISVSPNPTSGKINVNSPSAVKLISVIDSNGKQVVSASHTNSVDLSNQSSGIYIVKVQTENGATTKKVIVK